MGSTEYTESETLDEHNCHMRFMNRKFSIEKKAYELSKLCDSEIAIIIFDKYNKLYEYSSNDINQILLKYNYYSGSYESLSNYDIAQKLNEQENHKREKLQARERRNKYNYSNVNTSLENEQNEQCINNVYVQENYSDCGYEVVPTFVPSSEPQENQLIPLSTVCLLTDSNFSELSDDEFNLSSVCGNDFAKIDKLFHAVLVSPQQTTPTPSPSPWPSPSPSPSSSPSPSPTLSPTLLPTPSLTPTPTFTPNINQTVSPLNTTNHCNKEERFSEFGDIIHTVCSFVFPHELTPRPNTETGNNQLETNVSGVNYNMQTRQTVLMAPKLKSLATASSFNCGEGKSLNRQALHEKYHPYTYTLHN